MEEYVNIDLNSLTKNTIRIIRGVYFLYRGNLLVYIGSSQNILNRIPDHFSTKEFDSYSYIEINGNININKVETLFIRKYKPEYNVSVVYNPSGEEIEFDKNFEKISKPRKKQYIKKVKPTKNEEIKVVFAGYKDQSDFLSSLLSILRRLQPES